MDPAGDAGEEGERGNFWKVKLGIIISEILSLSK